MPLVVAVVRTVRLYTATISPHIAVTVVVQVFTCTLWRRILHYVDIEEKAALGKRDTKTERLRQQGALNRHPETVGASWFQAGGFFDARDLVQVKYEMLRHVRVDGVQKASAATLFGVSRPTFYQAQAAFAQEGLAGLLPKPRGPKSAHKLTPEVSVHRDAAGRRAIAGRTVAGPADPSRAWSLGPPSQYRTRPGAEKKTLSRSDPATSLPASLAAMYESLRAEVIEGHARPDGIGAVVYHGLVHGMTLLVGSMRTGASSTPRSSTAIVISRNPELLHVLANMVLQTQSEVMHVY